MSFLNWFRRSSPAATSSRLRDILARVLAWLHTQPKGQEIVPYILARAIHENESVALTALRILTEQGITVEHFGLYCGERDIPLASEDSIEKLPAIAACVDCEEDHSRFRGETKVSVYYTVNTEALDQKFTEFALG